LEVDEITGKKRTGISEWVAEIAPERGVSERTVWRWVAAMRISGSDELLIRPRICEECDDPLPEGSTIRRRYCRAACRIKANRRNPQASASNSPLSAPSVGIGHLSDAGQSPAAGGNDTV
jgi:hypothetical protein